MIDIRPFNSLGHANHGWLDARHHFSFANYHDPKRMGWGRIRVWIDTDRPSAPPSWGAKPFPKDSREGEFQLLASGDKDDGALSINADARILGATVKAGEKIAIDASPDRHLYLVPSGRVRVNGVE